jgi:predicted phage terminase large subunit-like protein
LDALLAWMVPLEGNSQTIREKLKVVSTNKRSMFKSALYMAHDHSNPTNIEDETTEILWSERFSKEFFIGEYNSKVELGTPEAYAQEYLNRPLDDTNAVFKKTDFVPMIEEEKKDIVSGKKPLTYYVGADLAISEKQKADWCVFHVAGMDNKGYLYHTNTIRARMDGKEIVDTMFDLFKQYEFEWLAIGQDQISSSIQSFLYERMISSGNVFQLVTIPTGGKDKVMRAKGIQGRMRMGSVKFDKNADYFQDLEAEFLQFPRGRKDDQVDAYAVLGQALAKMQTAPTREQIDEEAFEQEKNEAGVFLDGRSNTTGY